MPFRKLPYGPPRLYPGANTCLHHTLHSQTGVCKSIRWVTLGVRDHSRHVIVAIVPPAINVLPQPMYEYEGRHLRDAFINLRTHPILGILCPKCLHESNHALGLRAGYELPELHSFLGAACSNARFLPVIGIRLTRSHIASRFVNRTTEGKRSCGSGSRGAVCFHMLRPVAVARSCNLIINGSLRP